MPNTNTFFNLSTFDSDCIVGVHLDDRVRSMSDQIKFVIARLIFDEDMLVEFEFMTCSGTIGTK